MENMIPSWHDWCRKHRPQNEEAFFICWSDAWNKAEEEHQAVIAELEREIRQVRARNQRLEEEINWVENQNRQPRKEKQT